MLVKELIYMILDTLKGLSDDFVYTEEHVLFLCKKYRSFLIKKEQEKEKSSQDVASEFETQEICLDLEPKQSDVPCVGGDYLWSKQKLPSILEGNQPRVYPIDYFQGTNVSFVSRDRMRYVGSNKYLQNMIYASLGADMHLYITSNNPQFKYLRKIRVSAVFEDVEAIADLQCDTDGNSTPCDYMDMTFPIRDYLVPLLIELVVKELSLGSLKRADERNNANDDLAKANTSSR